MNRTLYVGRIHVTDDIEVSWLLILLRPLDWRLTHSQEVVARHFAEWGQIERIRVLTVCSNLTLRILSGHELTNSIRAKVWHS